MEINVEGEKLESETVIHEETAQADEDAELLALEEELALLEQEEEERKAAEEAETLDLSSDDLWQVDSGTSAKEDTGGIRFAEDIAGLRETDPGRRGGRRGGSSARNRRRR